MIYVISITVVILFGFLGKTITKNIVLRDKFYKELKSMLVHFENSILYKREKIKELFFIYYPKYPELFKDILTGLRDYCLNSKDCNITFLKLEEGIEIRKFFKDFGCADEECELKKIREFSKYIDNKSLEYSDVRKKNEGVVYKVCLALGVVVCILIV